MCTYTATYHPTCSHTTFLLSTFCLDLLRELKRINDPLQRKLLALPFDAPECAPRVGANVRSVEVRGGGVPCSACLGGVDV